MLMTEQAMQDTSVGGTLKFKGCYVQLDVQYSDNLCHVYVSADESVMLTGCFTTGITCAM